VFPAVPPVDSGGLGFVPIVTCFRVIREENGGGELKGWEIPVVALNKP
tara:strand:+ start:1172 stop:1315 length:144 start_codon:yes stop_codon:yes gene_type:complete